MNLAVHDAPAPPTFQFWEIVRVAMRESQRAGKSPVRFLGLGGDVKRRRTGMRWNPSTLSGCVRKAIYKASGCPMDPDFETPEEQQLVFDRGSVMGAWMAAYARAADGHAGISDVECQVWDREEMLATDSGLSLGGFVDIAFSRYEHRHAAEVKSKDNDAAMDKITKPDPLQLRQLNDYMGMTGIYSGWLVYVGLSESAKGRQTLRPIEFPHVFDPEMYEETARRIRMLEMMLRASDRLGPKSSRPYFECSGCPWRQSCDRALTPLSLLQVRTAP